MESTASSSQGRPWSLSSRILVGLAAGIVCGLVFGERCAWLKVLGKAFIDLLQMTVLPYVAVGLINSVGRLDGDSARRLAGRAGVVLLVLWGVAAVSIVLVATALPEVRPPSFFSTSMLQEPHPVDLVEQYIPANPFHTLANNLVPAVVLFSLCVGAALIGIERKAALLDALDVFCTALMRINSFIVRLTPYGVFAIAAAAAGVMTGDDFVRLQAYLLLYSIAGAVLALGVLPALIVSTTPFTYRQVVGTCRDAVVTAFATGKLFVVLPLLIEASNRLMDELEPAPDRSPVRADILIPLAYPFPSAGKLLGLLFIPFAAWYSGGGLAARDYPLLLGAGLLTFFGSPVVAVPYLLDLFRLPADLFGLFLVSGVYTMRVGDALGAVHLLAFTLLASCATLGCLRLRPRTLIMAFASITVVGAAVLLATASHLRASAPGVDEGARLLERLQPTVEPVEHTVLDVAGPNPEPLGEGESHLERIMRRKAIRIGFDADRLPFAFLDASGDLVGYDIDMAHLLARQLGVSIEFVPFVRADLAGQLDADRFDLAMSGITRTVDDLTAIRFADTGLELTAAVVMPDHLRHEFSDLASIRRLGPVRAGVVGRHDLAERLRAETPNVEFVVIDSHRAFFEGDDGDLVALLTTAEAGSAWTLVHPGYHVVVPQPVQRFAHAYPVARGAEALHDYVEDWAALVRADGTAQKMFDHWVLGRGARREEPRWSVVRNVLGWE